MLEVGARFNNRLYAKLSMPDLDSDDTETFVSIEYTTDEGVQLMTGEVVWDEG